MQPESSVSSHGTDIAAAATVAGPAPRQEQENATAPQQLPEIPDATARQNEEFRMLLIGFATGLTIAGVFLVYVVLDYAKFLH